MRAHYLTAAAAVIGCSSAPAQSNLADRILGVREGTVRLTYAVREGVCGDGESFIRDRGRGGKGDNYTTFNDGEKRYRNRNWRDLPCEPGPARIAFSMVPGGLSKIRLYVGGEWGTAGSGVTDLGTVSAPVAAKAFIRIASREPQAGKAIFAAMIADSAVVWPDLLDLAKSDAPKAIRKDAIFWLSQAAADEATKGLTDLVDNSQDREIRDAAIFAISQRPAEQSVPILIRLVRTNRDPEVRRKALFWLGQSDDPRALKLIEEILVKGE